MLITGLAFEFSGLINALASYPPFQSRASIILDSNFPLRYNSKKYCVFDIPIPYADPDENQNSGLSICSDISPII